MRTAGVDPAAVDAGAVGFRLAPRINAAGRLGHPRAALELLLTDDVDEARRLADELEDAQPRAAGRRGADPAATRSRRSRRGPRRERRRKGYVVAGADWHEGVIGIVASRLVERYNRPVVLIAGGEEATGRAPALDRPSFDLHGALAACAGVPRALRRPPRRRRPLDPPRAGRGVRRPRSPRTPSTSCSARRTSRR